MKRRATDCQICAYCELPFENARALRTHIIKSHPRSSLQDVHIPDTIIGTATDTESESSSSSDEMQDFILEDTTFCEDAGICEPKEEKTDTYDAIDILEIKFAALSTRCGLSNSTIKAVLVWAKALQEAVSLNPSLRKICVDPRTLKRRIQAASCQVPMSETRLQSTIDLSQHGFKDVQFSFENPRTVIEELLSDATLNHSENIQLGSIEEKDEFGNNVFSDLSSALWIKQTSQMLLSKKKDAAVLPLIWAADSVNLDNRGKRSVKPIYLTLGIFKTHIRRLAIAKRVIGFFPDIESTKAQQKTIAYRKAKRDLYHKCWDVIMKNIDFKTPFSYLGLHLYPVNMIAQMDHPEAQLFAKVKNSYRTSYPCRLCLAPRDQMNDMRTSFVFRTSTLFQECLVKKWTQEDDFSFHVDLESGVLASGFFGGPGGIYFGTPACLLHIFLSQGLVKKAISFLLACVHSGKELPTVEIVIDIENEVPVKKSVRGAATRMQLLDQRIASIPSFASKGRWLRTFQGVSNLSFLTGQDYLSLIQIIEFALHPNDGALFSIEVGNALLQLFQSLRSLVFQCFATKKWYLSDIENLKRLIEEFSNAMIYFKSLSKSELKFSKFHALKHFPEYIQMFGALENIDGGHFETAHKVHAKEPWRHCSRTRSDYQEQMLNYLTFWRSILKIEDEFEFEGPSETPSVDETRNKGISFEITKKNLHPWVPISRIGGLIKSALSIDEVDISKCLILNSLVIANGEIIRVQHKEKENWVCSDVEVKIEKGLWFARVIMLMIYCGKKYTLVRNLRTISSGKDVASVNGLKVHKRLQKVYCSWAEDRLDPRKISVDLVEVTSIVRKVHLVPDFEKKNFFFVNDPLYF